MKLDDSLTDIYRPEVAGDFDLTGKTESSDEQKFNMGGFTEFIADATLNHSPDLLESHKELCSYINNQGGRLDLKNHYSGSFCASNWINLSEKLDEIAPFEENAKIFLTNSGTESVETAIKLAKYKSKRHNFLGFYGHNLFHYPFTDGRLERLLVDQIDRNAEEMRQFPLQIKKS